jgi:hypothetical protein
MIAIVNVSKNPTPTGVQEYELRINHDVITKFTHRREEGLVRCLQKAALAVDIAMLEITKESEK